MSDLRYKLDKLDLSGGTPDKKEIVVLKFLEDGQPNQIMSLQAELQTLKNEAQWENVCFLVLPPHIHLAKLSDEDLESMNLYRK
jgi:hypothetical protein